jgi:hypothetical protein
MPDTKITALTALTTADPANDMMPIVDVSDTTMAASGTTKRISINNILACSPSATLASATITGDLTVDTNTLKVDSTNNRVGVLNTPTVPFEVTGLIAASGSGFQAGAANGIFAGLNNDGTNPGLDLRRWTGTANNHGTAYIATSSSGDALFYTDAQASNTRATTLRMTLNSTGLGVGVTPAGTGGCLQLKSGITFPATQVASSDANTLDDYEEGSWVPTLNSGTFSSASCRYTKIGNMVTIFFDVTVGTGGGNQITNLPFTAAATSTVANGIYTNNQDYAAGTTAPVVVVGGSSATLFFRTVGDNVAFSAMTLTAAANLTGSISYFV